MKSFREHLTEGNTSAAFEMERVIVAAAGGPSFTAKDKKITPDAGDKIVKTLNLKGKGAMPKNSYDVTPEWSKHFAKGVKGGTKTPKTDFLIGDKRISLKTGDGAQLMSGGKEEATATFYAAINSGKIPIKGEIKKLESHFKGMLPATTPEMKGSAGDLVKNQKSDIVNKANEVHMQFKKDLRDVFKNNKDFAYAFTFEAMTGVQKFGRKGVGAAQYFLITDWDGDPCKIHDAFKEKAYVKKIAGQVVPEARFKSSSKKKMVSGVGTKTGFYNIYSAVGLGLTKMTEELDSLEGELLTEALLDKIKGVWTKFTTYLKKIFDQAVAWIGDSWDKLFQFLNLEPEVAFNNNNIKW